MTAKAAVPRRCAGMKAAIVRTPTTQGKEDPIRDGRRRRHRRPRPMPGDELVGEATYRTTLDNLIGLDMNSAERIQPALQKLEVADVVRLVPEGTRPSPAVQGRTPRTAARVGAGCRLPRAPRRSRQVSPSRDGPCSSRWARHLAARRQLPERLQPTLARFTGDGESDSEHRDRVAASAADDRSRLTDGPSDVEADVSASGRRARRAAGGIKTFRPRVASQGRSGLEGRVSGKIVLLVSATTRSASSVKRCARSRASWGRAVGAA